jgi:alkyldihydroxyacetonephosphate synthase
MSDWIALRSGRIGTFPDGVAYPASDEDVRALLDHARATGTRLIPYGGGSSVVGHVNPLAGDAPVLTVDLTRLGRLVNLDETSRLATFEAGVVGPDLERQLGERGYTLGHFPQSWEFSTLGGWIATRSSGQQSYHYGRIEALFAGGHVETLLGPLELPALPASAAGPDLRQVVLGSEGRLGVITRATVRVRPLPVDERFEAIFFHDWEAGATAVREIVQAGVPVSLLRFSDAQETETTLALAGRERLIGWADRGLRMTGYGDTRCMLLFALTEHEEPGSAAQRALAYAAADRTPELVKGIARAHGGLAVGTAAGSIWARSRFRAPYLRNTLWERGYALDTVETAVPWCNTMAAAAAMKAAIAGALQDAQERVLVFAHLSHVYVDGASIYVTYLYRRAADPDETLRRWQQCKGAASQAVIAHGGTISHQHGVGLDHAPYLAAEKGAVGMKLLEAVRQAADPGGLLNPGKLLSD